MNMVDVSEKYKEYSEFVVLHSAEVTKFFKPGKYDNDSGGGPGWKLLQIFEEQTIPHSSKEYDGGVKIFNGEKRTMFLFGRNEVASTLFKKSE